VQVNVNVEDPSTQSHVQHHPAVLAVGIASIIQPPGFVAEFGGALTRAEFADFARAAWRPDAALDTRTSLPAVYHPPAGRHLREK
jgi:hypothetical protein